VHYTKRITKSTTLNALIKTYSIDTKRLDGVSEKKEREKTIYAGSQGGLLITFTNDY